MVDITTMGNTDAWPAVLKIFKNNIKEVIRHAQKIYENDITISRENAAPPEFVSMEPSHGSYHVVVPVEARDIARYLYKIPLDGIKGKWDSPSERSLKTEAETMKRLFNTIPVPFVYDFSATIDNPIGCPFIVISEILGHSLYDVWFGHQLHPEKVSRQQTREHRVRALEGIAETMVKLDQFSATEAGAPVFNDKGELASVGTTRVVDRLAMDEGSQSADNEDPPTSSTSARDSGTETAEVRGVTSTLADGVFWVLRGIASLAPASLFGSVPQGDTSPDAPSAQSDANDDELQAIIYGNCEPTTEPGEYYTRSLDLHPQEHPYSNGVERFLRLLISCIPEPDIGCDSYGKDLFVLSHPDFNIQNFIVKSDGTLMGIIDWDGVETVPRSVGNLALPGWLTRDWDSIRYVYEPIMEDEKAISDGYQPESLWEDSKEQLAEYRDMYAALIGRFMSQDSAEVSVAAANICRRSLLTENLAIAASDHVCRARILEKVVSEMWAALIEKDPGLDLSGDEDTLESDLYPTFYGIAQTYLDGEVDEAFEDHIREGFAALLKSLDKK